MEGVDLSHLQGIGLPMCNSAFSKDVGRQPASKKSKSAGDGRPVVTRFAPSPTGYLHIGGARTALFCYLCAKHSNGKFLIRIEDTDLERNDEGAVEALIKGLNWLGLYHDGEIIRQSTRIARHKEVAAQLLASGGAYKAYDTKEELDAMRAQAEKDKVPFRYSGKYRDIGPDFLPPKGVQPVVRIKTPNDDGVTAWEDGVMGRIEIPNKDLDDFIILRGDGTPTYLLAVVVDDHDMGVTQVIRGSDHIPNTGRQIAIFNNCKWELPNFAHIPLIHGPDGKKLSKRHGATGVEQYEAMGYLPEAMRNYLSRLSWAHGDDEIFSTEQAIEWFELSGCSKSAPCFDYDKLNAVSMHYIKECDPNRLTDILEKLYPECKKISQKLRDPKVAEIMKVRSHTLVEYREQADFLFPQRPLAITAASAKNLASDAAKQNLKELAAEFKNFKGEWSVENLEPLVKSFAEKKGAKLGDVAKPTRAALTGQVNSPSLFDVIWSVGKEEAIGRMLDASEGKNTIREEKPKEPPAAAASPTAAAAPAAKKPAAAPAATGLTGAAAEAAATEVGNDIRALKEKLKKEGLSGKKIDAHDEVKALVAKLQDLKKAAAAGPAAPAAPAPGAPAAGGDLNAQVTAVGNDIRALKEKLKKEGLSGKKIDAHDEVKALVAQLQDLKARAGPAAAAPAAAAPAAPAAAAPAAGGSIADQATAVGNDIRALKEKLKKEGMSGKKIDKEPEVVELVAKLQGLKAQM